ncbi:hypothetical protein ISU10_02365 [Nocardioides agariphilus]|uniref:Uncharacterized protein n=1 Tax=Nocardioides agariphilus TaxID=433664 RepID=A0A930VFL8_9ACTN|nr:hypothetical protein [Nocardioides agariphilus]MBF4766609.1 hypothetical protein [Nocardioides agariphilus]
MIEGFVRVSYLGGAHKAQVKVRHENGSLAGLEEWVRTRDLACAWSDLATLVRDQARAARLDAADSQVWDQVTAEAISAVMIASGEYNGFARSWNTLPNTARRFWARAGLDGSPLEHHAANYMDLHGQWRLSFLTALAACQGFAATEPELVDLYLRDWEDELRAEGFQPGSRYSHTVLRKCAPAHALARAWTQIPRGDALERELGRLQGLLLAAAASLRQHGCESDAARIERGMRGA